jgi:alanyl-tRNA synthetase
LTGNEVRKTFLKFFEERGHRVVRSSSLVPTNDPTLLFTNAGMNQFKDVFLGLEQRDYRRATSCQKCVRAGGKHNDLENVGFTNRHHTFFEMLGNFSFGDYFKKEAIAYAWELITGKDWYAIPKEKLYFTVFGGAELAGLELPADEEAQSLWLKIGAPKDRVLRIPGLKENFWQMGDNGPCGPCSELHYDMGPAASDQGHKDCAFPCDCGRYVEIWNLVFMQFNRDTNGALNPLPKPSVDTGAGLERLAAVMQGKISNFGTDLFTPLIREAEKFVPAKYGRDPKLDASFRIVADHARATTFLIGDGVIPSNEGRDYVLRKIMRRGMRHARLLDPPKPFFSDMVLAVRELMAPAYPELMGEAGAHIQKVVSEEERRFERTVDVGLIKLEEDLGQLTGSTDRTYAGEKAFRLYDTYGLPRDFIEDVTRDAGIHVDWAGFDGAMAEQRTRARASWKGGNKDVANPAYAKLAETFKTEPDFYFGTAMRDCRIEAIITKQGAVNEITKGTEAEIVLDRTAIYS